MVLVPQREGFGLCGATPSPLYIAAWLKEHGPPRLDLLARHDNLSINFSRISFNSIDSGQAAQLQPCPGVRQGS